MTEINERKTALDIYADIKKGMPSQTALQNMESYVTGAAPDGIPKRSRSFITQLVYGTLENYIYIDFIISEFTGKPVSKLKPFIANVLEISVFQLLFTKNIPDHAIVNEAVRLVQASPQRGLKGFVNAVLRNIARSKDTLPEIKGNEERVLALRYSVPEFIVKIISDSLDALASTGLANPLTELVEVSIKKQKKINEGTEDVLQGLRNTRPLTIRCNTSLVTPDELRELLSGEGVKVTECDLLPRYAMMISGYDSIPALQTFKDGLFYVQDVGSILSGEASAFKPGERVLDLCGAPGGKAIGAALAGAFVDTGDVSEAKADLIRENISRLKLKDISVSVRDACVFDPELEEMYDVVICDVPCSGIGIIGRKPDIALNLSLEKIDSLAALQRKILETAVRYVKPGGRLIYSTCTINYLENVNNGRWAETLGLEPLFEKQWLPSRDEVTDGFYTKIFKKV